MLGCIYAILLVYWIITLYRCKEYIIALHYLMLAWLTLNFLQSVAGYYSNYYENAGKESKSYI